MIYEFQQEMCRQNRGKTILSVQKDIESINKKKNRATEKFSFEVHPQLNGKNTSKPDMQNP